MTSWFAHNSSGISLAAGASAAELDLIILTSAATEKLARTWLPGGDRRVFPAASRSIRTPSCRHWFSEPDKDVKRIADLGADCVSARLVGSAP